MTGAHIVLPVYVGDAERPLWASPEAAVLRERLKALLADLSRDHAVAVTGPETGLPDWARTLGPPMITVPMREAPGPCLLPLGGEAALRALAASGVPGSGFGAVVDFRSPLLAAGTVRGVLADLARDAAPRLAVAPAALNTAIMECPWDILSAKQVALADPDAAPGDVPAAITERMGPHAGLSRPFSLPGALSGPAASDWGDTSWLALVAPQGTFSLDPGLPVFVPLSGLGHSRHARDRFLAVFELLPGEGCRRLFPRIDLPEGFVFHGMDALWEPDAATILCLIRAGEAQLWMHESLAVPAVWVRAWEMRDGAVAGQCFGRMAAAGERITVGGRVFVGPVLAVDGGVDAVVCRMERPAAGARADFVEPVRLQRPLWDMDPGTGMKRNRATGAAILGRQNYPENLSPTLGLAAGRMADLLGIDARGKAGELRALRLEPAQAVSVRDLPSLFRAVVMARDTQDGAA